MVKDSCVGVAKDSYVAKDNCALEVKGKKKYYFILCSYGCSEYL